MKRLNCKTSVNARPTPRLHHGRYLKKQRTYLRRRHPLRCFYYAKHAKGRGKRVETILMGMKWNYYLRYGKTIPKIKPLQPPKFPPVVSGLMKNRKWRAYKLLRQEIKAQEKSKTGFAIKNVPVRNWKETEYPAADLKHKIFIKDHKEISKDKPPKEVKYRKAEMKCKEVWAAVVHEERTDSPRIPKLRHRVFAASPVTIKHSAPEKNTKKTETRTERHAPVVHHQKASREEHHAKAEKPKAAKADVKIRAPAPQAPLIIQRIRKSEIIVPVIAPRTVHAEKTKKPEPAALRIMVRRPATKVKSRRRPAKEIIAAITEKITGKAASRKEITQTAFRASAPKPESPRAERKDVGYISSYRKKYFQLKVAKGADALPPQN